MLNEYYDLVLLLNLSATLFMVGVIWFVQIVHYPLLGQVGEPDFANYERLHMRWTTFVVMPPMLLEAVTAIWLAIDNSDSFYPILSWTGLLLLAIIWGSTFLLQVPRHEQLANGFDAGAHHLLVLGNWLRTLAWSGRGLLILGMVWQKMHS